MKITQKQLEQIIREELSKLDPCPKLDEKIGNLLMSKDKDSIIAGLVLYSDLHMHLFDIVLHAHGGKPSQGTKGPLPDPRIHIEFSGPDSEKFMKCLSLEALLPQPDKIDMYLNRFKRMGKFKFSFIPNVGTRHSTWLVELRKTMVYTT